MKPPVAMKVEKTKPRRKKGNKTNRIKGRKREY